MQMRMYRIGVLGRVVIFPPAFAELWRVLFATRGWAEGGGGDGDRGSIGGSSGHSSGGSIGTAPIVCSKFSAVSL